MITNNKQLKINMKNTNKIIIWVAYRDTEIVFKVDPTIRNLIAKDQNIKSPKSLIISIDTKSDMEFYYGENVLESQIPVLLLGVSSEKLFEMFEFTKIEFRNSSNNNLIYSINKDGKG